MGSVFPTTANSGCPKSETCAWLGPATCPSKPSSVTVIKTADDRYFCSFVVEIGDETQRPVLDEHGRDVEIDLDAGLSAFAVDQHGNAITNPKFLRRAERELKRTQGNSAASSGDRTTGTRIVKLVRQHAEVADARLNWLHQETSRLVRENQLIVAEDLAVSGLARGRLARSVHDAGWGMFRRLSEEKCARQGRVLVIIGRWLPTSETCSACGAVKDSAPLKTRVFSGAACGAELDRDVNAAINILTAGRKLAAEARREGERLNACGSDVGPRTGAVGAEAGTHRGRVV